MTTITLAGRDFKLRPLTLRQLRIIEPAFLRGVGLGDSQAFGEAVSVVDAALSRDYPEMTGDALLDAEITHDEMREAVTRIGEHAGLLRKDGEPAPGEAAAAASTGEI